MDAIAEQQHAAAEYRVPSHGRPRFAVGGCVGSTATHTLPAAEEPGRYLHELVCTHAGVLPVPVRNPDRQILSFVGENVRSV